MDEVDRQVMIDERMRKNRSLYRGFSIYGDYGDALGIDTVKELPSVEENEPNGGRRQYRCGLCGVEGHNARTCPNRGRRGRRKGQKGHCSICGDTGHNARTCPDKI